MTDPVTEPVDITVEQSSHRPTVWNVRVHGELDHVSGRRLLAAVEDVVAHGAALVLLHLQHTTLVDSRGLHALERADRRLRDAGGRLMIETLSSPARRALQLTGLLDTIAAPGA